VTWRWAEKADGRPRTTPCPRAARERPRAHVERVVSRRNGTARRLRSNDFDARTFCSTRRPAQAS
jgi:hypothetical protein